MSIDCALPYSPGHVLQIDLVQERIIPRRLGRTVDVIDLLVRNLEPEKKVSELYLLYPNTLPDESFQTRSYLKTPGDKSHEETIKDFVKLQRRASRYPAGTRPWWPWCSVWRYGLIDRTGDLTKEDWVDNAIYHDPVGAEFNLSEQPGAPRRWRFDGWFYLQPETVNAELAQSSELLKGFGGKPGIDLRLSRIYCNGEVRPFEQTVGIADDLTEEECRLLSDTGFSLIKVSFAPQGEITNEPRWLRLEMWPTRCNNVRGDCGWWSILIKRLTFQNVHVECTCVGGRGVKRDFKSSLDIIRRHAENKKENVTVQRVQGLDRKILGDGLLADSTSSEVRHAMISFQRTWRIQLSDATAHHCSMLDLPSFHMGVPGADTLARFLTGFAYAHNWRYHPVLIAQCIQGRLSRYFYKPDQAKSTQEIAKELDVNTALCGAVLHWMVQHGQVKEAGPDKFFWDRQVASVDALLSLYSAPFNEIYRELHDARPCSLDFRARVKLTRTNILTPLTIWLAISVNLPKVIHWLLSNLGLTHGK